MNPIQSLISYGDKIQIGVEEEEDDNQITKKIKKKIAIPKFEIEPSDPENQSLKAFIDSILPPKEIVENHLIFYQFVSCDSAILNDVLKLNRELDNQMKVRGAKEKGISTIREELYAECLDEIIRQITIGCLQRGDILNKIKIQLKFTKAYYQKLYESLIAFSLRKVLQEKKKMLKLEKKQQELNDEIRQLNEDIEAQERELEAKEKEELEKEKQIKEDHDEAMKVLKIENEQKSALAIKILTTPREEVLSKGTE